MSNTNDKGKKPARTGRAARLKEIKERQRRRTGETDILTKQQDNLPSNDSESVDPKVEEGGEIDLTISPPVDDDKVVEVAAIEDSVDDETTETVEEPPVVIEPSAEDAEEVVVQAGSDDPPVGDPTTAADAAESEEEEEEEEKSKEAEKNDSKTGLLAIGIIFFLLIAAFVYVTCKNNAWDKKQKAGKVIALTKTVNEQRAKIYDLENQPESNISFYSPSSEWLPKQIVNSLRKKGGHAATKDNARFIIFVKKVGCQYILEILENPGDPTQSTSLVSTSYDPQWEVMPEEVQEFLDSL